MSDPVNFEIIKAKCIADFTVAGRLFREYAQSIGIDLSFQHFEEELQSLEQQYAVPAGALLLVRSGGIYGGCAGIRAWNENTCELKRMYLRPEFRSKGIGKGLLLAACDTARTLGYRTMRLDSLPHMTAAIRLYRSFGFEDILPYRPNPVEGAVFLEKQLV